MKKQIYTFSICLSLFLYGICAIAWAHGGRLDANGGHKDNQNVSGLGYYHYHCGHTPAHLHENGICPYQTTANTAAESSPQDKAPTTSVSDIHAYIGQQFIPSYNYKGHTYVIAEDLNNYGYDVLWHSKTRTLTIKENQQKAMTISQTQNPNMEYEILSSDIVAQLYNPSTNSYETIDSYNIGGQTIIPLSALSDDLVWDEEERAIFI